ncbi:MAG TPA: glycosyltransferase [Ktedonobacteraceae bacterium]|jgi:ceramide glucosyltransferase|nr:glycosyltransferase [Ktedonobacteraceae bacterium]
MLDWLAYGLASIFALDRILKLAAVVHFFRRPSPPPPVKWPPITLFQPITRGVSGLPDSLRSRLRLDYPAPIQHLLICDAHDGEMIAACEALHAQFPTLQARIIAVETNNGAIATKIEKLLAAIPHATGEVFWFLDDDVALRPQAARLMIPYLYRPGVGAVFGLACYTNWRTLWSSLMSAFVNANALLSYIPITYLTEPYTITGHCFALRREVFEAAGGFSSMEQRIDDDHELARRVRQLGLRCVQTPMIYDVDNDFDSLSAYNKQLKRWFIFPRQAMLPYLTRWEKTVSFIGSASNLLPALLALLTVFTRRRSALQALGMSLGLFIAVYAVCQLGYLKRHMPVKRWLLLPFVALIIPLQILKALISNEEIEWRGQRLRIRRGGKMEVLS